MVGFASVVVVGFVASAAGVGYLGRVVGVEFGFGLDRW